ncbi:MAG: J domain-containing protein [Armatimonadetes bacterium]|nr:J domain-containing protein [Armatimonadota bacterium]
MSEIRRAYDLLRGYINHEWDRIRSSDLDQYWQPKTNDARTGSDAGESVEASEPVSRPADPKAVARGILGVTEEAGLDDVRKAFDRLNKRSNPANFPEGSEEASMALKLQARVNWAYRTLTADIPSSELRFKSLELD